MLPASPIAFACFLACLSTSATGDYRAAVFEYRAVSPCGLESCGKEQNAASLEKFDLAAADAAAKGCQIIVFPEYGITGFSNLDREAWITGGYAEEVPVSLSQSLCEGNSLQRYPSTATLSCIAQRHGIVVVANLMEHHEGRLYNTDIAMDQSGLFVGKYRKKNLWGEQQQVDVPSGCDVVSFPTHFGVTFGLFTCADLIYEHPAHHLLAAGIRDFAVPVAWSNEMSQMQVLGYAQGWSLSNGANLLLANHHGAAESGSAVATSSSSYISSSATLLGHGLSTYYRSSSHESSTLPGSSWRFAPLSEEASTLCSGSVCCTATDLRAATRVGWVLAVLNGKDTGGGGQACALLPCSAASAACLRSQPPRHRLEGISLTMVGIENGTGEALPEVLVGDVVSLANSTVSEDDVTVDGAERVHRGGEPPSLVKEMLLPPQEAGRNDTDTFNFSWNRSSGNASLRVRAFTRPVVSAIIYTRQFHKDSLPYRCPPARMFPVI
eukprot:CAMPEP_0178440128 /NCGR_PEP_ID=MMETSP0689_2-20121128/36575_1 /TAXON_ID=160604 /ORGANISM="Amphidinium massartii, Strain CS-259" /LENGTH=494 /DNA_ID=CAMNT_0020062805 /DNA_START=68 /DNA_END=1548 /DNA_ORIENTATION=+